MISFTACSCTSLPTAFDATSTLQPTPIKHPTIPLVPTVELATTFEEGKSEIPTGFYLFVEFLVLYYGEASPSVECEGATMIDFPTYAWNGTTLSTIEKLNGVGSTLGFFGFGQSNSGAMGGGASTTLYNIDSLPYRLPSYDAITLHSVERSGAIVIEIWAKTFFLEPGRQWIHIAEDDPNPGCHRISTYTFTNHGLLNESQLGK
jgi:hypothetical protein